MESVWLQMPLFQGEPPASLQALAGGAREAHYKERQVVVRQGQEPEELYIIRRGGIRVCILAILASHRLPERKTCHGNFDANSGCARMLSVRLQTTVFRQGWGRSQDESLPPKSCPSLHLEACLIRIVRRHDPGLGWQASAP